MATGQVLLQRFYCKKSFTKYPVKVLTLPPSQPPSDTLILIGCVSRRPIYTTCHPRWNVSRGAFRVQMSIRRKPDVRRRRACGLQHGWSNG